MSNMDAELFPPNELHTAELNPIVGRRLFAQKMNQLKMMRRRLVNKQDLIRSSKTRSIELHKIAHD